jgi:hypothetical protein
VNGVRRYDWSRDINLNWEVQPESGYKTRVISSDQSRAYDRSRAYEQSRGIPGV